MAQYRYKAINAAGATVEGQMEAPDELSVVRHLQGLGHIPVRAEAAKASLWSARLIDLFPRRKRPVSQRNVMLLTRSLATLLGSGVPLERALDVLRTTTSEDRMKELVSRILDEIRGGRTLTDALKDQPDVFSPLYVSMIQAGETGGALEAVFGRMADYLERMESTRSEVKTALIYPCVLLVTACASVFALVAFVVPRFEPLFASAGRDLPLATQILVALARGAQSYWWLLVVAAVLSILVAQRLRQDPRWRRDWDRLILRLRLVGCLIGELEVARFTRTLGTLLSNGVPLVSALGIAQETVSNRAIRGELTQVVAAVKSGRRMSDELESARGFPELSRQLLRIGEESGQLEQMLYRTADIHEQKVQRSVQRLISILTPALTVVLGIVIAGVIASILVAILSVNEIGL